MKSILKILFVFILTICDYFVYSQFAPEVGINGSTAIYKDSNIFISWADSCFVTRGYANLSDTSIGKVTYGIESNAIGKADNLVVSLGDGGSAIIKFNKVIKNGNGYDFAVFENALNDSFLELAFVDVSSDGINFFRFNSVSNTQTYTQVETFGSIETTKIHNLAGKYRNLYGTPFDLDELKNIEGLNVDSIKYVKVIDVVGDISGNFSSYDSKSNIINDPFPTPFNTGGFDLDAVGVINNSDNTYIIDNYYKKEFCNIFPNATSNFLNLNFNYEISFAEITLLDIQSKLILKHTLKNRNNILDISNIDKGVYILFVNYNNLIYSQKIIKL